MGERKGERFEDRFRVFVREKSDRRRERESFWRSIMVFGEGRRVTESKRGSVERESSESERAQ